ncbi:hypothetical protein AYO38_01625 [bacterium SCGC AG-212-C10]|nr:hypothetical protein AYO38_01625 [bacterium SCGC AG-212-C10]
MLTTYFFGEHPYQMDERFRVPLPLDYRNAFGDRAFITNGPANCVLLYTEATFADEIARIQALPKNELGEKARRHFFSSVAEVKRDGQGRITLKEQHVRHAGLSREVMVIGAGEKMEIWDRATWDGQKEALGEALQEALNRVEQFPPSNGGKGE